MPPVADQPNPWKSTLDQFLDANERKGQKPDSVRALAKVMSDQSGGVPNAESWRSTLVRVRRGWLPSEDVAAAIATALDKQRGEFPEASTRLSLFGLNRRLQEVEEKGATILEVGQMQEPLKEAIRRLASGDSAGALRVLMEAEAQ